MSDARADVNSVRGSAVLKPVLYGRRLPQLGIYCCLIGNSLKAMGAKETFVFIASDPVYATVLHNRRETSMKETRNIAPHWHLLLVLGPFPTSELARECAQRWVNCTRGCNSKMRRGLELARKLNVHCFSCEVRPRGGTRRFLKRHVSARHARVYRRFLKVHV